MTVDDIVYVTCPSALAYGEVGAGEVIPPVIKNFTKYFFLRTLIWSSKLNWSLLVNTRRSIYEIIIIRSIYIFIIR